MTKARIDGAQGRWWGKSLLAGMIGGMGMGVYEMMATWLMGKGFWTPLNMIGATVPAFQPPAMGFVAGPTLAGLMLHMVTSAMWGLMFGLALAAFGPRLARSWGGQTLLGAIWGVVVYLVMGIGIGPWLDSAMRLANPVQFFIGHLVFGIVAAWSLFAMARKLPE
jgi:hypothetical protein